MVWFIKKLLDALSGRIGDEAILGYCFVFAVLVMLGLLVMLLILSNLNRRQEQLEGERLRAVESSRAKSEFLFNISHDLRTPMNAILGFTHLARKPGASADEKERYLFKIDRAGEQLLNIINDVLDMSQIENGQMTISPAPTVVSEVVREAGELLEPQMREKGIDFAVDTERAGTD